MTARLKHPWRKILSVAQWPLKTSWQVLNWFYKDGLTRVLLGIVLLLEIRRGFIKGRGVAFDVPRPLFFFVLRGGGGLFFFLSTPPFFWFWFCFFFVNNN